MKIFLSALLAVTSLYAASVQATEASTNLIDSAEPYVIEPIIETTDWRCPKGTKVIAKYCWNSAYGTFMKCGYICHPVDGPGKGTGVGP